MKSCFSKGRAAHLVSASTEDRRRRKRSRNIKGPSESRTSEGAAAGNATLRTRIHQVLARPGVTAGPGVPPASEPLVHARPACHGSSARALTWSVTSTATGGFAARGPHAQVAASGSALSAAGRRSSRSAVQWKEASTNTRPGPHLEPADRGGQWRGWGAPYRHLENHAQFLPVNHRG